MEKSPARRENFSVVIFSRSPYRWVLATIKGYPRVSLTNSLKP